MLATAHLEGRATPLDQLEFLTLDVRTRVVGRRPPSPDVVVIAIDDQTVAAAAAYPLPRDKLAQLVETLAADGVRSVALDVLFVSAGNQEADDALARALGKTRSVIAAAATFGSDQTSQLSAEGLPGVPLAESVIWPVEPFRSRSGVGSVNLASDQGGTPRFVPLVVRVGQSVLPSLPLIAASLFTGDDARLSPDSVVLGSRHIPTDIGGHLVLRYVGPRGSVATISAASVLDGSAAPALRGKMAVIGVTAIGAGDVFATPFDAVLPGVEVIATATAELIDATPLVRDKLTRRIDAGVAFAFSLAAALLLGFARPGAGLIAATLVVGWLAVALWAFSADYWLNITMPLAAALASGAAAFAARLVLDRRASAQATKAVGAFQPFQQPALAECLTRNPDFLIRPEDRDVSIVFIDLNGFTGLSERVGPQKARDFLAIFHSQVEEHANAHGGIVASYQGDGAMILFGLLESSVRDAAKALAAARSLSDATELLLRALPAELSPLGVKLGAHCGLVNLSRLGHSTHQHITAIGDPVNVASRLMGVAAQHGAAIAISSELLNAASQVCSDIAEGFGPAIEASLRGREHPIDVHLAFSSQSGPKA